MLKEIEFKKVEEMGIAIIPDHTNDIHVTWTAYFLNMSEHDLSNVIINSFGHGEIDGEKRKTSTLRWFLGDVEPDSFTKIEDITSDLTNFSNEFWVSFFIGNQIYDKKYVFVKGSINFENLTTLPYFFEKGILIK